MPSIDSQVRRGLALGTGLWLAALAMVPLLACVQSPAQPPQRAQQERAVASPKGSQPVEPLSPAAQAILRPRMVSHAHDMNDLVSAIMVLDYPSIADRADKIASDANLSRPITDDATELNSSIPAKFFDHQDRARAEARGLSEAARALDPYQVASKYGRLSESCVRCHADYRPRG